MNKLETMFKLGELHLTEKYLEHPTITICMIAFWPFQATKVKS